MKINFNVTLCNLEGKPIETTIDKEKVKLTLRLACVVAMSEMTDSDRNEDGISKHTRWTVARRIFKAKEPIDISVEILTQIKERLGKIYGPAVVGPAYEILEGREYEPGKLDNAEVDEAEEPTS